MNLAEDEMNVAENTLGQELMRGYQRWYTNAAWREEEGERLTRADDGTEEWEGDLEGEVTERDLEGGGEGAADDEW
eukprot:7698808-Heterocapsa_arctica.AAC.1